MGTQEDELARLQDTYRSMDTEELSDRIKRGTLTPTALFAAAKELEARGIAPTEALASTPLPHEPTPASHGFIERCFKGGEPLWLAFCGFALPAHILCGLVYRLTPGSVLWHVADFAITAPLNVAILIVVWRCAKRASHWFFFLLARTWVVLNTALALLILFAGP